MLSRFTCELAQKWSTERDNERDNNIRHVSVLKQDKTKNFTPRASEVFQQSIHIHQSAFASPAQHSREDVDEQLGGQKSLKWSLKAQEGIIAYQLPDALLDGVALHNKLQKLMKSDIIYLNDRRFWFELENRFKNLRKKQREQDLIAKGLLPHTTEEAIKTLVHEYDEQKRVRKANKMDFAEAMKNPSKAKSCLADYVQRKHVHLIDGVGVPEDQDPLGEGGELEAYETNDVHPRLHKIFTDYKFETTSGKQMAEKYEKELLEAQAKVKTIFPKANQRDMIRQELEAVKTSEGLYAYSNRLLKQILQ
ncbi:unnamed protein product [Didymodactylos carnosus]|uniref:Uncharacterized protein n=1 Tax=Didymodactylos carnosus TaxID=1234261 RepID=A0A814BU69_9BILA|nr:unnamed protein product [Didymodactylos carnosus]CAF0934711.1 unnamed protein product [Didymodactylos carnosus]CAF3571057.1 unnamed protein product [Didymodactylos carnosus]CAF3712164.1 unnamed protein product [Didymodactylos carnosus]